MGKDSGEGENNETGGIKHSPPTLTSYNLGVVRCVWVRAVECIWYILMAILPRY